MPDFGSGTPQVAEQVPPVICTMGRQFGGFAAFGMWGMQQQNIAAPAASAVVTANRAYLFPFTLPQAKTAYKGGVLNGGAVAGNVDIGIYDENFNRLVSSGATLQAGTTQVQDLDFADTALNAGKYYLGVSYSNGAATNIMLAFAAIIPTGQPTKGTGMVEMAAAHPLPATITPAAPSATFAYLTACLYFRASP